MIQLDSVRFWLDDTSLSWARKQSVVLAFNNKHVMRGHKGTTNLLNLIVLALPPGLKLDALKNSVLADQISSYANDML